MISNLFNIEIKKDTRDKEFDENGNNPSSRSLNRWEESYIGEKSPGDKAIR